MMTIGDFARLGRVSVRMLRHYDAIGLLVPEHVDPRTGYRYYTADQVRRLNRIVALKDLGLHLDQVHAIVEDRIDGVELRAMLRLREAELAERITVDRHRLARVQARLRLIEAEDTLSQPDIVTKTVPAATGLGLTGIAASVTHEDIGPVSSALFPRVLGALSAAGAHPTGPPTAFYSPAPQESDDALTVQVVFPASAPTVPGLDEIDIPPAEVASLIHQGSMDSIDVTYQTLNNWVREQGFTATGSAREIYLEVTDNPAEWVTEVQLDFRR